MSKERLLRLRQLMKKKRPKFVHQEHWKKKRFKNAPWRRPKGKRSKMRAKERAKPSLVSIGYRGPKKVRGYHPKGVPEVIVHTVKDITDLVEQEGTHEHVIKIASGVGTRKKIDIVQKAVENKLYVANPGIKFVKFSTVEELESFKSIKEYVNTFIVSDKVPEDIQEEIEERAEELGIEVVA
ncbi:MAG: 50S ribosomal protein L32e [Candidatus Methanofastidiosia archaeon]|jgi:large subunit ribosomal protein L32e